MGNAALRKKGGMLDWTNNSLKGTDFEINRLFALSAKIIRRLRTALKIITPNSKYEHKETKESFFFKKKKRKSYLLRVNKITRDLQANINYWGLNQRKE